MHWLCIISFPYKKRTLDFFLVSFLSKKPFEMGKNCTPRSRDWTFQNVGQSSDDHILSRDNNYCVLYTFAKNRFRYIMSDINIFCGTA